MFNHAECPDKHTPQTPNKDEAREWWMDRCDSYGHLITVSPGAHGALRWKKWGGPILVCDICAACVEAARGWAKRTSAYTVLNIKALHADIQTATRLWCERHAKRKLSAVDVDLAFNVINARPILNSVVSTLAEFGVHTKVLLTYVNHRDGFGYRADARRIKYLSEQLPAGVEYVQSHNYSSGWSDEHHNYSKGSAMSIAEFQT